jgi:lipopolysaccharide export system permease protein
MRKDFTKIHSAKTKYLTPNTERQTPNAEPRTPNGKRTLKKLTLLVLRAFAGPMLVTFLISLFVLLMQFLWKYIDDLVGKGLDTMIIVKLMIYVSITLIPLALPLSLLLSSIMTFGNLAEHFELTACKSAGVSLQRVMRPLTITALLICVLAFYFSNYVLPVANLKMNALLYDVRNQKPALLIKEGIFYNGIDGYSIRIAKKDPDGQLLHDILIYDHTQSRGNTKMIMAERGKMAMSDDERYLLLTLYKGSSYEEQENRPGRMSRPFLRTEFEEELVRFDLTSFKLTRTNEQLFKDNYQMLNLRQLTHSSDSLRKKLVERQNDLYRQLISYYGIDTNLAHHHEVVQPAFSSDTITPTRRQVVFTSSISTVKNIQSMLSDAKQDLLNKTRVLSKHQIEWQRKFTLSFACLILFFIGAPLGAIIRKGGLGMPVVVSVFFFVIYHIISISGEKFAREGVIPAWKGMWLSAAILLPVGVFLTYKATRDSALFEGDAYTKFIRRFFTRRFSDTNEQTDPS